MSVVVVSLQIGDVIMLTSCPTNQDKHAAILSAKTTEFGKNNREVPVTQTNAANWC